VTPLRTPLNLPVRALRANLAATLRRLGADGEYVVLTRRGVPLAAIVPLGALDMLDAADALFAERARAATGGLHDLATAAPDVTPSAPSAPGPDGRPGDCASRGQSVPRRG